MTIIIVTLAVVDHCIVCICNIYSITSISIRLTIGDSSRIRCVIKFDSITTIKVCLTTTYCTIHWIGRKVDSEIIITIPWRIVDSTIIWTVEIYSVSMVRIWRDIIDGSIIWREKTYSIGIVWCMVSSYSIFRSINGYIIKNSIWLRTYVNHTTGQIYRTI